LLRLVNVTLSALASLMEETCHVLFVCLGNICRSPAGENIFRHQVTESGLSDCITCDSAGTAGYHIGKSPDARMTKAMRHRGYQVTGGARQFAPDDFNRFDLILTMDDDNYRDIISQARSNDQRKRVRCFTDFCTEHEETEVPDPYYGGDEGFEFVADLIEDGSAGIIAHLRKTRGL